MRFFFKLTAVLCTAVLSLMTATGTAYAAKTGFPDKPIHLVVPFPPGGAVDMLGRLIGQHLSQQTGQSVIVENRPGANGNIGTEYVVRSAPDGYTILLGSNGLASSGLVYSHRDFNELKDLAPVGYVGSAPLILVVSENYPAKSLKDILDMARKDPNAVSYASAGFGSSANLASEALKYAAHVQILHVPYKGGAPALVDLTAGRVSFMMLDPLQAMPQIRSGRLRALLIGTDKHLSLLPKVQTAGEAGFPDLNATVWWGFMAPVNTPKPIIQKLNSELNVALKSSDVQKRLNALGVTVDPGSPEKFGTFIRAQVVKWIPIVKAAGIRAD